MNSLPHLRVSPLCRSSVRWAVCLAILAGGLASPARAQTAAEEQKAQAAQKLTGKTGPTGPLPGLATALSRQANLEGRVMWMDATANLQRLSTRESMSDIFEKCKKANINTVVLDVKPLSGHVIYPSKIAPRLKEWKGFQYPEGFDPLFAAMLEGHRRGIRVYASVNVFSEGHKLVKSGPLYEKRDQQAIVYDCERTVTAADGATWTLTTGTNRGPATDQISAYDPEFSDLKKLGPTDAAVVVQGQTITAVVDGSLTDGGIPVPADGHLLVGRGTGAAWLLEHSQVGQNLTYAVKEVLQPILDAPSEAVGGFVNPANPESRKYALQVVAELAENYAVDGIVFDRMRYSSLRTDFSQLSRDQFEAWLGKKLDRFPQDIYSYDPVPGRPLVPGPYFKEWLEWRAKTINDWLDEARGVIQRSRPGLGIGVYVGSWYSTYYAVGVNWASDEYAAGYDWMTPKYSSTGYAQKLSWIATGCYYRTATREDARQLGVPEDYTVEAAAQASVRAVNDSSFVYAGLNVLDYAGKPEEFRKALEAAAANSQGVMLFDLVYIEEYNWWNILSDVFTAPRRAPHDVPGLQAAIQETKKALKALRVER